MSDFEQWFNINFDIIPKQHKGIAELTWNAAIAAELVKALSDDSFAATFQSMAGYRTALIAKAKGVVG